MILVIHAKAEAWIENHRVAGTPTAYAAGVGAYEWVNDGRHFPPFTTGQKSSLFMVGFRLAAQEHRHCDNGVLP